MVLSGWADGALGQVNARPSPQVKGAVASRPVRPGVSPDDGAVTVNVAEAEAPWPTVPRDAGPDGETVHPGEGGVSDTDALPSGARVGLVSVALTVNVP